MPDKYLTKATSHDILKAMNKSEMLYMRLEGATYQKIGIKAGVSRQRVQQLLSPPSSIRKFVVNKFDGKCSRCGIFVGQSGQVHHNGDNPETYNDVENLELLCISCHRDAHRHDIVNIKRKVDRNKLVIFREKHPTWSIASIARLFHITRQRVWQILTEEQQKGQND